MRDVKKAIPDLGLEMYDIYSYYLQPEMEWDLIMPSRFRRRTRRQVPPGHVGDDTEWQRMGDNVGRIAEKLKPMNIQVVVEAYANALSPMAKAVKFCTDNREHNIGICMDPRQGYRDEKERCFELLRDVDRALLPYAQINDSSVLGNNGILPGEGQVPLYAYLDALPAGIDLSMEAQIPNDFSYTGAEWCKMSVERTHKFLDRYYAAKK